MLSESAQHAVRQARAARAARVANARACNADGKTDCYNGCFPPGSVGRKQMLVCSFCCLSCNSTCVGQARRNGDHVGWNAEAMGLPKHVVAPLFRPDF